MTAPASGLFHPFGVYLPGPDLARQVAAPEYDSLPPDERTADADRRALGFLDLIRSEVDFGRGDPQRLATLLTEASDRLRQLLAGTTFVHHPGPVFLIVRISDGAHTQTGVIADVAVDAYDRGRVRVHESTRAEQETRLLRYMEAVRANFLPIFLIHRAEGAVEAVVDELAARPPALEVSTEDGITHQVWVVDAPRDVAHVGAALDRLGTLYIADGHHRAAASSRYAAERRAAGTAAPGSEADQRFLAVLFSADELVVHDYNRCVALPPGMSLPQLLARIGENWRVSEVEGPARPRTPGEIGMFVRGCWFRLQVPRDAAHLDPPDSLDVSMLHDRLLAPIFGIENPRTDPGIQFVPGTFGLAEIERVCADGATAGFVIYPPSLEELLEVADRGALMPPKSTWFAPKLKSGLVIRLLD